MAAYRTRDFNHFGEEVLDGSSTMNIPEQSTP